MMTCPNCLKFVGIFHKDATHFLKKEISMKPKMANVLLLSFSQTNSCTMAALLEETLSLRGMSVSITPCHIKKSDFSKLDIEELPAADAYIVLHKCEGRVLLTEANGVYSRLVDQLLERRSRVL